MAKNVRKIARKLGAQIAGKAPETGAGVWGAARLAGVLSARLRPSRGRRPGRPTNAAWVRRPKVPMSDETLNCLSQLAKQLSTSERKISPMQVAAQLLEESITGYRADAK
jgi:hypothetical protein